MRILQADNLKLQTQCLELKEECKTLLETIQQQELELTNSRQRIFELETERWASILEQAALPDPKFAEKRCRELAMVVRHRMYEIDGSRDRIDKLRDRIMDLEFERRGRYAARGLERDRSIALRRRGVLGSSGIDE